jgi:2-oxoglutarate ferredoxin oxidoreductase subunit delta
VLVMSQKFNAKGYHYPEVADLDKCSGCDLCGMYCPDFAVTGKRVPL